MTDGNNNLQILDAPSGTLQPLLLNESIVSACKSNLSPYFMVMSLDKAPSKVLFLTFDFLSIDTARTAGGKVFVVF